MELFTQRVVLDVLFDLVDDLGDRAALSIDLIQSMTSNLGSHSRLPKLGNDLPSNVAAIELVFVSTMLLGSKQLSCLSATNALHVFIPQKC